jgi:hypothetical protein
MKMETWLRMNDIPHENVDIETYTVSPISQVPQIKVNGKEIPYSSQIYCELAKMFNKETTTTDGIDVTPPADNGSQRAFEGLIEGRFHWVLIYMRATQASQLPSNDVFQGRLWPFLRPLANKVVTNKLKTKADHQGIGRQNAADVLATGKEDLRAISAYLGTKDYLAGEQPNQLDATAFAHLCQFYYVPIDNELKTFVNEQCPNLVTYLDRMKTRYWSDWEEKCRKPAPPKEKTRKTKDEPLVAVVTTEQENGNENKEGEVALNGCPEKETPVEAKSVKIESTVEITTVTPTTTIEEKKEIVVALENGVNDEQKHATTTPNGGTATIEKVAE